METTENRALKGSLHRAGATLDSDIFRLSAAIGVWYLVTYVLLPIPAVRLGVDESWRAFLTWAFEHHKQFGTEVIFTYGPWGFLLEPRGTISAYPWQILGRSVLAIAASAGIGMLGASWMRSRMPRWIWAATIAVLADLSMVLPVLLLLVTMPKGIESRWKNLVVVLLAVACGFAACTKFTCFLLVAALLPLLVLRKCLVAAAATVISFLVFWVAAGQALSNLSAFVTQSMEVSNGYTSAMVAGRPGIELLLALLLCLLPLLQLTRQILLPIDLEKLVCLGWVAIYEFLLFRHAVIRCDAFHDYVAFLAVGMPVAVLLMAVRGGDSKTLAVRWKGRYGVIVSGALALTIFAAAPAIKQRAALFMESVRLYPVYVQEFTSGGAGGLATPADAVGSMDVFSDELSYAIQRGLPLHNRPVFQAYVGFTKRLCEKNAEFLESRDAPQQIYFHSESIDDRYPTMEDALAWRSMLTHYAPSSVVDGYLVLQRRERAAGYELKPILDRSINTGEILEIPETATGLVWAELQVQRTPAGRLLDLLYRKEKMLLRVETTRRAMDFTLLDETASTGFLLSPYLNNRAAMMDLFQPEGHQSSAENVRRILVKRGKMASLGFGHEVRIRLYSMVIKP